MSVQIKQGVDENLGRGGFAVRTPPHPWPRVLCSASLLSSQGKHFPVRLMTKTTTNPVYQRLSKCLTCFVISHRSPIKRKDPTLRFRMEVETGESLVEVLETAGSGAT